MSSDVALSSGGASVLAAAYSEYVSSARRPSDWVDFVESVSHAMAPLSHSFPEGQPALTAGALTELPRIGVSASDAAAGAQLQRSSAATFEALLDQLFLTQGYYNSHHTNVADAARAGSSIPLGGLSDLRVLSSTGYRSLKDLFMARDPTLEALFAQYRDLGGAASAGAYQDFLQSIIALSTRWKRFVFYREDPVHYATQARVLFNVLDELLQRQLITHGEYDFIEDVLYSQTHGPESAGRYTDEHNDSGGDEFLMAAWSLAYETLSPDSGASLSQQGKAVAELYDSLLHLLERQVSLIYARYTHEASAFLKQLNRNAGGHHQLPPASLKHLHRLIEHQDALESAAQRGMELKLTPLQESMSKQSAVMFAAFAESAQSQNSFELLDSLHIIGASWKKYSPHTVLLNCLTYLCEQHLLSGSELQHVEKLVYENDAVLLQHWEMYASIDHDADALFTKTCFDRFVGVVKQCVERVFEKEIEQLARVGYALINQFSVKPDPLPQLYSDPARMGAVGLPPAVELQAPVASFDLPDDLRATLSVAHTVVLRDLCARRDPVLMALLHEHSETDDLEELVDGLERLLDRESDSSHKRRNQAAEQQAVEDEELDVYQLCQMLASLHADGYLATQTFQQLVQAVREQRDPVLLAAFSIYKEGISRGELHNRYWPEMWNSLQLVFQRMQREEEEEEEQAQAAAKEEESNKSAGNDYLSLKGAELLDALSASNIVSITDTLYLRDLLRSADDTLLAILSLYVEGKQSGDELLETLILLGTRWQAELSSEERSCARLLTSLSHNSQLYSARALDYLLGLVYARDTTLAAVYSLYNDAIKSLDQEANNYSSSSHVQEDEMEEKYQSTSTKKKQQKQQQQQQELDDYRRISKCEKALDEFVDTLRIILVAGNRTITELNGGNSDL